MHLEPSTVRLDRGGRGGVLIPVWRFDMADLSPRQRIDAWHEACSGFYDVIIDKDRVAGFTAFFAWYRLDNLMFSSGVSHPHRAKRKPTHVGQQKNYVRLLFSRQGGSNVIIDEHVAELGGDRIHLIDYSRPFVHLRNESMSLDGVYVPHDEIGYDPSRHPAYMCVGVGTPVGRVLAGAFFALKDQLLQVEASEAPILATGFSDLVRTLMLRDSRHERGLAAVRTARHEAMRAYIERHLRDPSLGIASLARSFAASRPTIYRDFEADGGVARYIMHRRLEHAYIDLVDHPPKRGAVRAVAERWGFESMSHFNRRFRARFGVAPSEIVALGADTGAGSPDAASDSPHPTIERAGSLSAWFAAIRVSGTF